MAPAKKAGATHGRKTAAAAANKTADKVTKPPAKPSARRTSRRVAAAIEESLLEEEVPKAVLTEKAGNSKANAKAKAPARGQKRAAAAEKNDNDDDFDMHDAPEEPLVIPPASDTNTKSKTTRGRPKKAAVVEIPDSATRQEPKKDMGRALRGRKATETKTVAPIVEEEDLIMVQEDIEIPETQQPTGAGDFNGDDLDDLMAHRSSPPVESGRRAPAATSSMSRRPPYTSSADNGDPALRRRLGEMTQKYESLEQKYHDLRDVAVREAERNFDRLKAQGEDKSKAADKLIASLKSDLAAQKEVAKEAQRLRRQLEASEAKVSVLQAQITEHGLQLSEARTEIKALNMRLTASRTAEAAAAAKNASIVPGSAMKGGNGSSRMIMGASEAVQHATLAAQMKEDLYGDLTGLIVRSVKRDGGEDVYDCIQTGRNGTLHFKLAIATDAPTDSYDEAQFLYMPQLDANRDRALIDMLPDYLVEEISFPRPHAAKFYARVTKALTESS
ncbi:chromosome segregation protein Csm1/Pcs1-domain-containing protein [Lasiosphaeria miniovina]|uniref:Chromosome segregation protein Csm1/Pcs1-domain-containing protein n=1 Tax=Lasiosphaeria miniovina TaxID=1954250 RepID=A0AA40AUA5_9PEZI|nr:chromosome segregation protein Csm1/Pcs1-domain-containing protein [Lasiosphaeria miniovina]KAK0722132.1 chromosome segregation protein Csm1/Pcs1-domain-containing protein [Lasiosphaeria miniovina]